MESVGVFEKMFVFENFWCVLILKVVFEKIFCNGSRLYKNVYKILFLLKNVSR